MIVNKSFPVSEGVQHRTDGRVVALGPDTEKKILPLLGRGTTPRKAILVFYHVPRHGIYCQSILDGIKQDTSLGSIAQEHGYPLEAVYPGKDFSYGMKITNGDIRISLACRIRASVADFPA